MTWPVIQPQPPDRPAPEAGARETEGMLSDPAKQAELTPRVIDALSRVFDPEIPLNVYDLGLIHAVILDAQSAVGIRMTLTAPACPAAQVLPDQVKRAVAAVPGVADVRVDVVWDPPWSYDRLSQAARLQLGLL